MIRFTGIPDKLTIQNIMFYTYKNNITNSRFANANRDCLPSTIKIVNRTSYKKNKEGEYSAPEEKLIIVSKSAPQYKPYTNYMRKGVNKQMKYKHQYEIIMCLQPINEKKEYSLDSKIVWRVGSYKKWDKKPKQKYVKIIYDETRKKLNEKYKDDKKRIDKEINSIKKTAPYLDVGDYNSQYLGLNGDNYFRNQFIQQKLNCLYGPCWYQESTNGIEMPFFCKHMISVISVLIRKNIIKT